MITIERMGRPFNVTEQVAAAIEKADLVKEKQQLEEQNEQLREELEMAAMATSEAHDGGAEWSFDSSDGTPVSLAGHTYRLDSDRFDSLYDSGLIGCLQTKNGQYWADSVTLDSLHDSGLVVLDESGIYMDAKCAGRGWMPGGPGGKCKRVAKGTAKKVASETAGINRLAKGGTKNEARSARMAELRSKLNRKAAGKKRAIGSQKIAEKLRGPQPSAERARAQLKGIESFKARAKAAGDRTAPARSKAGSAKSASKGENSRKLPKLSAKEISELKPMKNPKAKKPAAREATLGSSLDDKNEAALQRSIRKLQRDVAAGKDWYF